MSHICLASFEPLLDQGQLHLSFSGPDYVKALPPRNDLSRERALAQITCFAQDEEIIAARVKDARHSLAARDCFLATLTELLAQEQLRKLEDYPEPDCLINGHEAKRLLERTYNRVEEIGVFNQRVFKKVKASCDTAIRRREMVSRLGFSDVALQDDHWRKVNFSFRILYFIFCDQRRGPVTEQEVQELFDSALKGVAEELRKAKKAGAKGEPESLKAREGLQAVNSKSISQLVTCPAPKPEGRTEASVSQALNTPTMDRRFDIELAIKLGNLVANFERNSGLFSRAEQFSNWAATALVGVVLSAKDRKTNEAAFHQLFNSENPFWSAFVVLQDLRDAAIHSMNMTRLMRGEVPADFRHDREVFDTTCKALYLMQAIIEVLGVLSGYSRSDTLSMAVCMIEVAKRPVNDQMRQGIRDAFMKIPELVSRTAAGRCIQFRSKIGPDVSFTPAQLFPVQRAVGSVRFFNYGFLGYTGPVFPNKASVAPAATRCLPVLDIPPEGWRQETSTNEVSLDDVAVPSSRLSSDTQIERHGHTLLCPDLRPLLQSPGLPGQIRAFLGDIIVNLRLWQAWCRQFNPNDLQERMEPGFLEELASLWQGSVDLMLAQKVDFRNFKSKAPEQAIVLLQDFLKKVVAIYRHPMNTDLNKTVLKHDWVAMAASKDSKFEFRVSAQKPFVLNMLSKTKGGDTRKTYRQLDVQPNRPAWLEQHEMQGPNAHLQVARGEERYDESRREGTRLCDYLRATDYASGDYLDIYAVARLHQIQLPSKLEIGEEAWKKAVGETPVHEQLATLEGYVQCLSSTKGLIATLARTFGTQITEKACREQGVDMERPVPLFKGTATLLISSAEKMFCESREQGAQLVFETFSQIRAKGADADKLRMQLALLQTPRLTVLPTMDEEQLFFVDQVYLAIVIREIATARENYGSPQLGRDKLVECLGEAVGAMLGFIQADIPRVAELRQAAIRAMTKALEGFTTAQPDFPAMLEFLNACHKLKKHDLLAEVAGVGSRYYELILLNVGLLGVSKQALHDGCATMSSLPATWATAKVVLLGLNKFASNKGQWRTHCPHLDEKHRGFVVRKTSHMSRLLDHIVVHAFYATGYASMDPATVIMLLEQQGELEKWEGQRKIHRSELFQLFNIQSLTSAGVPQDHLSPQLQPPEIVEEVTYHPPSGLPPGFVSTDQMALQKLVTALQNLKVPQDGSSSESQQIATHQASASSRIPSMVSGIQMTPLPSDMMGPQIIDGAQVHLPPGISMAEVQQQFAAFAQGLEHMGGGAASLPSLKLDEFLEELDHFPVIAELVRDIQAFISSCEICPAPRFFADAWGKEDREPVVAQFNRYIALRRRVAHALVELEANTIAGEKMFVEGEEMSVKLVKLQQAASLMVIAAKSWGRRAYSDFAEASGAIEQGLSELSSKEMTQRLKDLPSNKVLVAYINQSGDIVFKEILGSSLIQS